MRAEAPLVSRSSSPSSREVGVEFGAPAPAEEHPSGGSKHCPARQGRHGQEQPGDPVKSELACLLLDQPLTEEGAEGGKPGQRQTAQREKGPRIGEIAGFAEYAPLVHAALSRQQDPDADEQTALHRTVGHDVDGRTGESLGFEERESQQEETCVAHGREREKPFQVMLQGAHDGTHDRGDHTHCDQHGAQLGHVRGHDPANVVQ